MNQQLTAKSSIIIHAPSTVVWETLTNASDIGHYMMGMQPLTDWKTGSELRWIGRHSERPEDHAKGVIRESKPGHRLSYSFYYPGYGYPDQPEYYNIITFEMANGQGQTELTVEQGDFAAFTEGATFRDHSQQFWDLVLTNMKKLVEAKSICTACGTQLPPGPVPELCPICADDRQFIPENGQTWMSFESLSNRYQVSIHAINPRLYELKMTPDFAIAQRAFLVITDEGNILWDCIPLLNTDVIEFIRSKGGLQAIAFSHPHYFSTMNTWADTFDCPVYIHENDEPWVLYKGPAIRLWREDRLALPGGVQVFCIGGHFPGSSLLHIPFLSPGGTILVGDSMYLARHKLHIAIMHSYPNQMPLPVSIVREIGEQVKRLPFDTLYGAFIWQNLEASAKELFVRSMERYR